MKVHVHIATCFIAGVLITAGIVKIRSQEQDYAKQAALLAQHQLARGQMCPLLQTRLQSAVVESRRHLTNGFDYLLVSDAFREVIIYAEVCVDVPPAAQLAIDHLTTPGRSSEPAELAAGVIALDDALTAAAQAEWRR